MVFRVTNEWVGTATPNSVESFTELINDKSSLSIRAHSTTFHSIFDRIRDDDAFHRMVAIVHEMSNHDVSQFEIANGKIMLSRISMLVSIFFLEPLIAFPMR